MTKRFFTLIAVLAISLLTACSHITSYSSCKGCSSYAEECCGACPCGPSVLESSKGKMCDPAMKKKHHRKHHQAKAAAAPTIPASAPAKDKTAPKAKAAAKAEPEAKKVDVFEGVKKIIQDVTPKDTKKPQ